MRMRNNAIAALVFLAAFASCRPADLHTNEEVARYCELKKGRHISYDALQDALYHTRVSGPSNHGTRESRIIRAVGDDGIAGSDTCWVTIWYDFRSERITDCGISCQ